MAWIESHQELGAHPKTKRLARMLNVSLVTTVGHLQFLWWWALNYAQDGSLENYDNCDIADAAGWEGDPDLFVDALLHCGGSNPGFLDYDDNGMLRVHDWHDYAGRLIDKRKANTERKRMSRQRPLSNEGTDEGCLTDVLRTEQGQEEDVSGCHGATVPNRTVPTVPKDLDPNNNNSQTPYPKSATDRDKLFRPLRPLPPGTREQILVDYSDSKTMTLGPQEGREPCQDTTAAARSSSTHMREDDTMIATAAGG